MKSPTNRPSRGSSTPSAAAEIIKVVVGGVIGVFLALMMLRYLGIDILGLSPPAPPAAENPEPEDPPRPIAATAPPRRNLNAPSSLPRASDSPPQEEFPEFPLTTDDNDRPNVAVTDLGLTEIKVRPILQGHQGPILAAAISPNSQMLVTGGSDNKMIAWRVANGQPADGAPCIARSLAFSPNGVLMAAAVGSQIDLWNLSKEQKQPLEGHRGDVLGVAFSPRGDVLVSCGSDGTVRWWNATNRRQQKKIDLPATPGAVAVDPTGLVVAAGCDDGMVRIYSNEGREGATLSGHKDKITSLAFGGDNLLAAASADGRLAIWDLAQPEQPKWLLDAHAGSANAVAWRPDSPLLASAGNDQVALWNALTGQKIANIGGHKKPIRALAFAPNGKFFVSAGDDGIAAIRDILINP